MAVTDDPNRLAQLEARLLALQQALKDCEAENSRFMMLHIRDGERLADLRVRIQQLPRYTRVGSDQPLTLPKLRDEGLVKWSDLADLLLPDGQTQQEPHG